MHDAFVVCRGQSACNLNRQLDRLADRQRAVLQPFLKRDAGEQFGNDIRRLLVAADVVDDKNVGVIERRSRASLLFEPSHPIRVGGKRRGQHFERDLTPKPWIARPIDVAHPARPEQVDHLIGAEERA